VKLKAPQRRRLVVLIASCVALVCAGMNLRCIVAQEDGTSILRPKYISRPVRLSRSSGWPQPVLVRVNWAIFNNGEFLFDEDLRPREASFDQSALMSNIAVCVMLVTVCCLLVIAGYDRRFSLRSLLLLMFCLAVLIALLRPYLKSTLDEHRRVTEFEARAAEYGY